MPQAQTVFDDLAEELAVGGAVKGRVFGMPCLKDPHGKAFLGLRGDELVVRLNRDCAEHDEALRLRGAHLFDPRGGRPLQDWVCLPLGVQDEWSAYALTARALPR